MKMCSKEISKLGFGMMRLPKTEEDKFDYEQINAMVDLYMQGGGNYFDTAYVYPGSEVATGNAVVKRHPRDSYYLATKMPAWEIKAEGDFERIFQEQLDRTGAQYFDYYLMHSISSPKSYERYLRFDCFEKAKKLKEQGKIRNVGFSFHSDPATMKRILSEQTDIDFIQLQINYADWNSPIIHSKALYEMVREKNIPIIVMEPVKGGLLANLSGEVEEVFRGCEPNASMASWAMRYAASFEGVITSLSGMSTVEQVGDNVATFENLAPFTTAQTQAIERAMQIFEKSNIVACTGCQYCLKGCPKKIAIPVIFSLTNNMRMAADHAPYHLRYSQAIENGGRAGDCINCGKCSEICPQKLDIPTLLGECSAMVD